MCQFIVYPNNYAWFEFCCDMVMWDFVHILQGHFTGTEIIIMIAPVPAKQPWMIWVSKPHDSKWTMIYHNQIKNQNTTKLYAYSMGYTPCV